MTFADILKQVLNGSDYPQNNDVRMAIPPMDGENAGKVMTPDRMQTQGEKPPADTVFKDNGDIAMDTNPFKSMIDKLPGGGQGTMTGMLKMLFGSDMKQEKAMDRSGVTPRMGGDGDPNTVPGQGQDAVLNPNPIAKQRQKTMQQRSGLIEPGNTDLNNRPTVMNDDGSISTILSKSFNFDGKETLLPTISDDGRKLTDAEAIAQYRQTGRHLGIFGDINSATKHAEGLHNEQAKRYKYAQPTALDPQSIEELRTSLLTQAGQLDPGNPNGLAGRMSSPLAPSDMGRQSQEAINISDDIRGHNGRKSAAIKKGNIR